MTGRPLSCEEARGLLDERLDRPLDGPPADPEEAAALLLHLDRCAACRAEARSLKSVHTALLGMDPPDPGAAFTDRVVAALDRAPGGGPREGSVPAPAPAGVRLLRGLVAAAGTAAFAALAIAVLPIDAAASTVGRIVPAIPTPALPALPPAAADLFAGIPGLVPPWAAALGALVAAAAAVPVAGLRRGGRRP